MPTGIKNSEYATQASVAVAGDLFDLTKKISSSPDIWESQKFDFDDLKDSILAPVIITLGTKLTQGGDDFNAPVVVGSTDPAHGLSFKSGNTIRGGFAAGGDFTIGDRFSYDYTNKRLKLGATAPVVSKFTSDNSDGSSQYAAFFYNAAGSDTVVGVSGGGTSISLDSFTNIGLNVNATGSAIAFNVSGDSVWSGIIGFTDGEGIDSFSASQTLNIGVFTSDVVSISRAGGNVKFNNLISGSGTHMMTIDRVTGIISAQAIPSGGSGTVTSVAVTVPSGLSVTGSPVTTSGTIAITTTLNGFIKGNGTGFTAVSTIGDSDLTEDYLMTDGSKQLVDDWVAGPFFAKFDDVTVGGPITGIDVFNYDYGISVQSNIIGINVSGTGDGIVTDVDGTAVYAASRTVAGLFSQNGILEANNTDNTVSIFREFDIDTFDATAPVLDIVDTSEATGAQFRITKQGFQKFLINYQGKVTIDDLAGTGDRYVVADSTGLLKTANSNIITSGTYTPTATNVANIDSSSVFVTMYSRIGNIVSFSGRVAIDATAANTLTELGLSLPIASDFTALEDCAGTITGGDAASKFPGHISADVTNNRIKITVGPSDTAQHFYYFTGSYRVK